MKRGVEEFSDERRVSTSRRRRRALTHEIGSNNNRKRRGERHGPVGDGGDDAGEESAGELEVKRSASDVGSTEF